MWSIQQAGMSESLASASSTRASAVQSDIPCQDPDAVSGHLYLGAVTWPSVRRFAKYYSDPNGAERRTLIKAYGIRFDIIVFGKVAWPPVPLVQSPLVFFWVGRGAEGPLCAPITTFSFSPITNRLGNLTSSPP